MEQKIENELRVKKELELLSEEELLTLSKDRDEFKKIMSGVSYSINGISVCYSYKFNDVLRKMIEENVNLYADDDELAADAGNILNYLNQYGDMGDGYRYEFSGQHEAIERSALGLDKLGIDLDDFYCHAYDVFRDIKDGDIDNAKNDKYYLPTISYLTRHYSRYLLKSDNLDEIKSSLCENKENKRLAKKVLNGINKKEKEMKKREKSCKTKMKRI